MASEFNSTPISKIRNIAQSSVRKVAAIAFVTKDHANFDEGDVVVCDASNRAIQSQATCRVLLRTWVETGVRVFSLQDLHAKMVVFDHQTAFVGSANFSEFAERRVESGIFTTDPVVVAECEKFIHGLTNRSEEIDGKFLKRIDGLKLKRVTPSPVPTPAKESPLKYWFFKGTAGHSKKALELESSMRSNWNDGISGETTGDFEEDEEILADENPLCFEALRHSGKKWVTGISKGDRVFWCCENDDYGWIVLPPRTVVSAANHGRSMMAGTEGRYWDEEDSVSLNVFIRQLGLRKNTSLACIDPSNPKLVELLANWDNLID